MQPAAQMQTVIDILDSMAERQAPADRVLAYIFRNNRYIGSKDKKVITTTLYALLRKQLALVHILKQGSMEPNARCLLLAHAIKQGMPLDEIFTGEKYQPEALNSGEETFVKNFHELAAKPMPKWAEHNIPEWILPKIPAEERALLNQAAPTDVRVNTLKTTREALFEELKLDFPEHEVSLTPHSATGIRVEPRAPLTSHELFRAGHFEVQDEGSQMLAQIIGSVVNLAAKPFVIDYCAGAGGKTLSLGALMENKGRLWACDIYPKKLEEAKRRAKRAGLHNIHPHVLLPEGDKALKRQNKKADVVFLDAPCSGSGTWRRNPDAKNRFMPEDLAEITQLQHNILARAKYLVKPEGYLFYATCSLLGAENKAQMETFSAENPDFIPVPLTNPVTKETAAAVQLSPATSNTDGFFMCCWQRKAV